MVNEFKRRRDTAKMIFKRYKACSFNKEVLLKRFTISAYEVDCYNDIYGWGFGRL